MYPMLLKRQFSSPLCFLVGAVNGIIPVLPNGNKILTIYLIFQKVISIHSGSMIIQLLSLDGKILCFFSMTSLKKK